MELPECLSPPVRPFLIAVLRQQVARIQAQSGFIVCCLATALGGKRSLLELPDVYPGWLSRAQCHLVAFEHQVTRCTWSGWGEHVTCYVQSVVQVVRGSRGREAGPEDFEDLLAVEAAARR